MAQAGLVELLHLVEQGRRAGLLVGQLLDPDHVAYELTQLRAWHDLDRAFGHNEQPAPVHPPERDAQLLGIDSGAAHHVRPRAVPADGVARCWPRGSTRRVTTLTSAVSRRWGFIFTCDTTGRIPRGSRREQA